MGRADLDEAEGGDGFLDEPPAELGIGHPDSL